MTTHTKKYKGGYPQRAGMKVGDGAVEIASLVPLWIFRFLGWGDQGIAVTCQKQGWPGFHQGQMARWSIRMVWPSRTSFVDRLVTESLELRWMGSSLTHSWNCVARKTSLSEEKWAWIITEGQGPSANNQAWDGLQIWCCVSGGVRCDLEEGPDDKITKISSICLIAFSQGPAGSHQSSCTGGGTCPAV